jgi:hypothetical protein
LPVESVSFPSKLTISFTTKKKRDQGREEGKKEERKAGRKKGKNGSS